MSASPLVTRKERRIPKGPALDLARLAARPAPTLPPPLNTDRARFCAYGRIALYDGLRALGIGPGANVLLPSFICRAVIAPFRALGVEVRYYAVDQELRPRLETATEVMDSRTRAFLAVHYFGFPQDPEPIRAFCRLHHLAFIEDNAHGFLSAHGERPLGTFGDIAIFSFRKSLPLPHGAALVLNRPDLIVPPRARSHSHSGRDILTFALRDSIRRLEVLTNLELIPRVRASGGTDSTVHEETTLDGYDVPYSRFADSLARRADLERERTTRRETFTLWLQRSKEWTTWSAVPVFRSMPDGVTPYGFPVRVDDRETFRKALSAQGISCFSWPDLPTCAPPSAMEPFVIIPVHRHPVGGTTG